MNGYSGWSAARSDLSSELLELAVLEFSEGLGGRTLLKKKRGRHGTAIGCPCPIDNVASGR